ncbi:YhgE/Pip domain-containing protein [Furfurilactobacillus siliginis]|nr:YhgE/Pip domain-containing protein [Furfurilactobacillus siliginis]
MIANEWKFIGKNRLILISVLAIMIIPFLYSIFFLKSVWNPYGETQHLPVAVVNNDQAVSYQGKTLSVGDEAVKSLKKDHQLGWRFVSEDKAQKGLKDKKYYTVVTFPKDTSKNAASVLSDNPKKMDIQYETNGSLNYIGEVISQIGASGLNEKIRQTIIKAYADATFQQIHKVGKGMNTAAKGAKTLSNGQKTLGNGLDTYTAYVSQVNDGVQTMKMSVGPLAGGVNQLADGGNALNTGLQQLNGSTGQLAGGVSQLAGGSQQLSGGISQYTAGVGTLNGGLQQLNGSTSQLANGVGQLNGGSKELLVGSEKVSAGVKALSDNVPNVNSGLDQITTQLQGVQGIMNQMSDSQATLENVQSLQNELKSSDLQGTLTDLQPLIQLAPNLGAIQAQVNQLGQMSGKLTEAQQGATAISGGNKQAADALVALKGQEKDPAIQAQLQGIADGLNKTSAGAQSLGDQLGQASTGVASAKGLSDQLAKIHVTDKDVKTLQNLGKLQEQVAAIENSKTVATLQSAETQKAIAALPGTINEALAPLQKDGQGGQIAKLRAFAAGVQQLNAGVNPTNGSKTLVQGATELSGGLGQLNAQVPSLTNGVAALANGSQQLNANSGALVSGANQLNGGLGQLNAQVPQLVSGVSQLANGSYQLSGGLNQLNGQIPALTNGVNQLADGTSQLNANSPALKDGSKKLVTGSVKLSGALGDGAKQVNSIPLSSKTSDMFSAPTKLTHKSYSKVANYGHALAPYVLSVALYVGAVVFNFAYPIRKISMSGQSATAWFFSKASVGLVVAVVQAVAETGLMLLFGLQVDHLVQMFSVAIAFSVASMFLVMFMSMLLDNPGRFIAMVLLMLQLGGSGGTFPMQVTNGFYNAIHPFLPMTYSILGLRQGLTSGLGAATAWNAVGLLSMMAIVFAALLWASMVFLQRIHLQGFSQLDDNQKLQEVEK